MIDAGSKRKKKLTVIFVSLFIVIGLLLTILMWVQGIFIPNNSSAKQYLVRGVDVSKYQGEINWSMLQKQEIQFAFIKATEGSGFVDSYFEKNWEKANETDLRVGAYHFFSFDSKGETQADNFINTVPDNQSLPPVIDIEFYDDKANHPPEPSEVKKELQVMVNRLEEHYDQGVIIYTTVEAYDLYIQNDFAQADIWIRDVLKKPSLSDQREWTFWQYTDREQLEGYSGEENFIDMNVFNGSENEFDEY